MKNILIRFGLLLPAMAAALMIFAVGCGDDGGDDEEVMTEFSAEHIRELRLEKDKMFRNPDESPLSANERAGFKALSYYPPNEEYFLPASLEIYDAPDTVTIRTNSATDVRKMLKYGKFSFTIADSTYGLFAYKSLEKGVTSLFVPFNDATNGKQTYQVGRYLDIEEEPNANEYLLDFNMAYNPYCAYSDRYTCPRVPAENTLPIPIPAGEKEYHPH